MPRLFIALRMPEPVRDALAQLCEPSSHGVSWVPRDKLHLTLRFIGDTEPQHVEPLVAKLTSIRVRPFLLPLQGAGAFPPRGQPQVLWVGVAHAQPGLFQLRQQVDDDLLALGLAPDLRRFIPHTTLARLRAEASPGFAEQWVRRHRAWEGPSFLATSFTLFASELRPTGAEYRSLAEFPLE